MFRATTIRALPPQPHDIFNSAFDVRSTVLFTSNLNYNKACDRVIFIVSVSGHKSYQGYGFMASKIQFPPDFVFLPIDTSEDNEGFSRQLAPPFKIKWLKK